MLGGGVEKAWDGEMHGKEVRFNDLFKSAT